MVGTMYKAMNDDTKSRKAVRLGQNIAALRATGLAFTERSENVWRMDTEWGAVMYYPATNTFQHKGKTGHGDVPSLVRWLHKLGLMP